jgi:hypothetical protein
MDQIEVEILRVAACFIFSNFPELRRIAPAAPWIPSKPS